MYIEYLINCSFSIEYTYENPKSKLRYYITKSILRFFASANRFITLDISISISL